MGGAPSLVPSWVFFRAWGDVVEEPVTVGSGSRRRRVGKSRWAAGISGYRLCHWGKNPWFPGSDLITAAWRSRHHTGWRPV